MLANAIFVATVIFLANILGLTIWSNASSGYAAPDGNSNTSIRRFTVDRTNSQPKFLPASARNRSREDFTRVWKP